ncbi:MAG: hypothetical protein RIC56_13805 [Pseudomonadales bacterium]
MKWVVRIVLGVVGLVVVVFGLQIVASETGEVVVLHARDADGGVAQTRLWVVDHGGRQYLRCGADGSGWFARLTASPEIELERGGELAEYRAVPEPELSAQINELMQQKYGWRDSLIGVLVGGRDGSVPVRLEAR